jgi:hypothetical protein
MSPVFGAVILWLATVILWWSGWKEETADGIPQRAVAIFLSGWPLFLGWRLSLTSSVSLHGAWIWMLALIVAVAWKMEASWRWTSVSAGLLLCACYVLFQRISHYPFEWSKVAAPWGAAILIGAVSAMLLKDASSQLLAISVAITLSEAILAIVSASVEGSVATEPLTWMRNWWIAVLFARLCATAILYALRLKRIFVEKFGWGREGEQP